MSQQSTIPLMVIAGLIIALSSICIAHSTNSTDSPTKRVDEITLSSVDEVKESKDVKRDSMMKASSNTHRKSLSPRKSPSITIPIKNAVVQALTPLAVDRNEAEAAHLSPSRHSSDHDPSLGEIIYEDELQGELGEWIPPPPPPPEYLYRKPSTYSAPASVPASTFQRLTGITRYPHSSSARLFGDDFALFLVILTIAGFFGLMLAMFMPFTFLLQQQPLSVSPYPTGQYGSAYGQYGYPYGRRRRRRHAPDQPVAWSRATDIGLADFIIHSFFKALSHYEQLNSKLDRKDSSSSKVPSFLKKIFTRTFLSKHSLRTKAGG